MPSEWMGVITVIANLVELAVRLSGKTTAEVLAEVEAENKRRAADPADETEPVSKEIDSHLPE